MNCRRFAAVLPRRLCAAQRGSTEVADLSDVRSDEDRRKGFVVTRPEGRYFGEGASNHLGIAAARGYRRGYAVEPAYMALHDGALGYIAQRRCPDASRYPYLLRCLPGGRGLPLAAELLRLADIGAAELRRVADQGKTVSGVQPLPAPVVAGLDGPRVDMELHGSAHSSDGPVPSSPAPQFAPFLLGDIARMEETLNGDG